MAYTNKHLVEIICGFQFLKAPSWDSTYFGQFYEKIKGHGFIEKQERKGFQIQFSTGLPNISPPSISAGQTNDDEVIFKNSNKGWAIAMGKNKLSFHIVKNYTNWEEFRDQLIVPFFKLYLDIGLGAGPRQCNVMYLNRFNKLVNENLDTYFTIVSPLNVGFGSESTTFVQRVFNHEGKNLLITKLSSQTSTTSKVINLECGAICINHDCINTADWIKQADDTHAPVRNFFEAIITDKLRNEL